MRSVLTGAEAVEAIVDSAEERGIPVGEHFLWTKRRRRQSGLILFFVFGKLLPPCSSRCAQCTVTQIENYRKKFEEFHE